MGKKVGIISLGCPKNLVDSEIMLGRLIDSGFEITNEEAEAEILIVNTCAFIESAKQEAVDTILEMADYKENHCELLIVTGCLAERYRDELMESMPEIDILIGTGGYAEIAYVIKAAYSSGKSNLYPELNSIDYLENPRLLTSDSGFAYLKISEGCDNRCTYCVIPSVRGRYRSRSVENILEEAKDLAESGKKEIILVSQDTTRYGIDLYGKKSLVKLVKELTKIKKIQWLRLLYCYPEEIDDELINEFKINKKLLSYIDVPIQHISDSILKAMGRRGTGTEIEGVISRLRAEVPDMTLRTSLIVGFPGETEKDFKQLCDFVQRTEFDRLGIFTYSQEEGTKAAEMENQIEESIKEKRLNEIMKIQEAINNKKNSARIGSNSNIIVEGVTEDGLYYGRTSGEAPDIDWIVKFDSEEELFPGDIVNAKIIEII
ncbi:MAG: 30S ribosomal protein S12 methylthiotransferase RimO [Spirochaetes bacterium]|nr:30S ribosomal protein S12 methylthiotransferase RimO [Spirochaetota bacterium]